ncbi:MAG: DUF3820 family protein [Bacteroidota bacterium]
MYSTPEQRRDLIKLLETRMPYGKYKGRLLIDLPEPYLAWYNGKGFPKGKMGEMLQAMYEIKLNGLEVMLRKIINSRPKY